MKGQIFRIAHLGFFDYMDTIALMGALEQVAHSLKLPGFAFGQSAHRRAECLRFASARRGSAAGLALAGRARLAETRSMR